MNHDVRQLCAQFGLADHAPQIEVLAEPAACIALTPTALEDIPLRAARFGGDPDLPPGMIWPRKGTRRHLNFLAQINLAEVSPLLGGARAGWPAAGDLCFFYDIAGGRGGDELSCFDEFCVMYIAPDVEVARCPRPEPLRDPDPSPIHRLPAAAVTFERCMTIPHAWELPSPLHRRIGEAYTHMHRESVRRNHGSRPCHQFGGHLVDVQDGTLRQCAMRRSGIGRDLPDHHPAWRESQALAGTWRLLLQIDADDALQLQWGDLGRLYFCASRHSTASATFDQYWSVVGD